MRKERELNILKSVSLSFVSSFSWLYQSSCVSCNEKVIETYPSGSTFTRHHLLGVSRGWLLPLEWCGAPAPLTAACIGPKFPRRKFLDGAVAGIWAQHSSTQAGMPEQRCCLLPFPFLGIGALLGVWESCTEALLCRTREPEDCRA